MRGGHNRLPGALKKARGTLRSTQTNVDEPMFAAAPLPPPPPDLRPDERDVWERLAGVIDPMRVATVADHEAFGLLVLAVALAWRTARDPKASVNQKIRTTSAAIALLTQFGLTPAERARVSSLAAESALHDPEAEFAVASRPTGSAR